MAPPPDGARGLSVTRRVTFQPSGIALDVAPGTTLYAAAMAAGLPVGSACEAAGICGACGLTVLAGAENLSPEGALERRVKADNRAPEGHRLSCLAVVRGEVAVTAGYW